MTQAIHLGYAVGSGEPVEVPLKHLAVTGQTQESGKTTTLEALAARAGRPTIAFVTKRGEGSFAGGRRLAPYFRDRADWQFVDQLLEAQLREKNKFLRPWIIRICRTTRTLADVHAAVKAALKKAKGLNEGVYTQLDAYLDLIVPEIARARLAGSIELAPGLNVMDVSGYPAPMQMLFVQSALDWINDRERGVTVIVPEAWEFIPEGKGSPVKASAVALVRKGAGLGNFIWVDSQDMAGVDKVILRGCAVWLVGAQREANEIKRNLANIPAGIQRPRPADIAGLKLGEFYACWKDRTVKTYVQPAWMAEVTARDIARGIKSAHNVRPFVPKAAPPPASSPVKPALQTRTDAATEAPTMPDPSADQKLDTLIGLMSRFVAGGQPAPAGGTPVARAAENVPPAPAYSVFPATEEEQLYQRFKARLQQEAPALLQILAVKPELQVEVERRVIEASGDSLRGRLALLLSEGFFDAGVTGHAVNKELGRRGGMAPVGSLYAELDELTRMGFFTVEPAKDKKSGKKYTAVAGTKVHVKK